MKKKKKNTQTVTWTFFNFSLTEVLFVFSVVIAVVVLICAISDTVIIKGNSFSFLGEFALGYLLLLLFAHLHGKAEEKEALQNEITRLNHEISNLKSSIKSDNVIIDLLEKENQQLRESYYRK